MDDGKRGAVDPEVLEQHKARLQKLADMVKAGEAMPLNCAQCGAGMYTAPPKGWQPGQWLRVQCAQCKAYTRFSGIDGAPPQKAGNRHQRRAQDASVKRQSAKRRANERERNAKAGPLGVAHVMQTDDGRVVVGEGGAK